MASSKNKLTEEQINEGLFNSILKGILNGRIDKVARAVADIPDIKKAAVDADKSIKRLQKKIKKANKSRAAATKGLHF